MEPAQYIEKISALFSKIMLDALEIKLPPEAGDIELTDSQLQGLLYLLRHDQTSVCELADGLSISHPAAVKMVDRLKKRDLVERHESDQDRRVCHVTLTETGRGLSEYVQAKRLQVLAVATRNMDQAELEGLLKGLESLLSAALESRTSVENVCLRCGTNHIGCCPVNRAHAAMTGTGINKT